MSSNSSREAASCVKPLLIGITGGIGSGKSTLSALLRKKGFRVFDCDAYTRRMTRKGSPLLKELAAQFGESVITKDGRLNRKRLARAAFADPVSTEKLNSMMHGEVLQGMRDFREKEGNRTNAPSLVFAEIPLLYEAGWERYVDLVWLVTADEEIRRSRVKDRDPSISDEDVAARMARQLPEDYKKERAERIFVNDGTVEELEGALDLALSELFAQGCGKSL